ncbi:MAG: hypothetical protein ACRCTY_00460, partial [Candidatus Adiutrix sp.]
TPKQFLPHQTKLAPHEVFLLSQGTESAPFKTLMAKPNEATSKIDKRPQGPETAAPEALIAGLDKNPLPPLSETFFSKTRGSAFHYLAFFPQDLWLKECCRRLSALTPTTVGEL